MTRPISWKRLPAMMAAVSLALAGVLLTVAPAQAAPGTLVVTSPTEGSESATRSVEFTGTGSDGAGVAAVNADASVIGAAEVVGGAWTLTLTFPADAPAAQAVTVSQVLPPDTEPDTVTVNIVLPAAVPADPAGAIVIDTPADGATLDSRSATFVGSAPIGSSVTIAIGDGDATVDLEVQADGSFELLVPLPFALGDTVTVTFAGLDANGAALVPVDVTVNLPAPIAAPVIVSPVTGADIAGTTVTFRGTGVAGNSVLVLVLPSGDIAAGAPAEIDPLALVPFGVVAADGTWTVSTTLPVGDYAAAAIHTTTPADAADAEALSLSSNEVAFSLVAPVAPATPSELAATGPTSTELIAPAALLMMTGLAFLVMNRRRKVATA